MSSLSRRFFSALSLLAAASPLAAATLPTGFAETQIAAGLSSPTAMAIAPDGRIFVCLQGGSLRVVKNHALLAAPFLTVSVNSAGERGLLGVAFDPDFASNQHVYVYYTTPTAPIHNRVSRFTANGDVAVPGSETVLVDLENLSSATNHNGGALHFGPDGKLYVAVGENAAPSNSQTLANRLGKLLRYNPDGTIPTDNPFFTTASGVNRSIWALGLRNPFTFAFQPGTGRMFVNDVGASAWEEINEGLAGANYGWPVTEGSTTNPSFVSPLYAYPHSGGAINGCAITGGAFYDPAQATFPPAYAGKYFFADFCSNWIKRFDPATGAVADFATGVSSPVDLQVSSEGDLYYLARGAGLFRVRYTANQAPTISIPPANRTVSEGQPASFTVVASGTAPLAYQWQRGGVNIQGATSATYTLAAAQLSDNGAQFRCVVSNAFGSVTSASATLTVTANQPPVATISAPAPGTLYTAGQAISYAGTGSDPEEGALGGARFTWRVDFHHDAHVHPFLPDTTGATTGAFTIPTSGHTESNVWYRIHLTVRDGAGLTGATFRDVLPRTAAVTLATSPSGLRLLLDGSPLTAPFAFTGVAGVVRTLEATSPQAVNGTTWVFASWSDAGARAHAISTPAVATTYTATFVKARAQMSSPAPGTTLASSATFAWSAGTGVTRYQLHLGSSPAGTDLFAGAPQTATSVVVNGLPTDGRAVHARLWSEISSVWEYEDYAYVAASGGDVFWVTATGSDTNPCTSASPCRQIRKALTLVGAGDTILVGDGSYLGFDVNEKHGAVGSPITIKALGGGAAVTPTTDRGDNRDTIFVTFSSHVVIDGLRASGANRAAVRVDQSPFVTVRNGVFANNRTWGIFTDFSDDLLLENNECHGSQLEHGIYVSNSGDRPVVRGNRVHDNNASGIQLNADLSAGGDGVITGALIEGNVIWNNGVAGGGAINLDGVQDSVVRNNVLYGNHATGIVNYKGDGAVGPSGMQILHNTVDQAADARWALLINEAEGTNVVRNNILHNRNASRGGITYLSPADVALTDSDYNVLDKVTPDDATTVLTLAQWQAQGHETHSLSATPAALFVNASAFDYHLAATSPAKDRGVTLAGVVVDADGKVRPNGSASDIGAFETGAYALRFRGNGVGDIDRVKVRVDDPGNVIPGPPVDVGAADFTLEFWMKAAAAENTAPAVACGANEDWILGNMVLDRDRYNQGRKFGVSVAGGRVVFGVTGTSGALTLCGTSSVLDNAWHHVAVARRLSDGQMWLFVDGSLQAQGNGPDGDVSYPDDAVPGNFCSGPCVNDPFLVIGAEKHDAGASYPSYSGFFDEMRVSRSLRYTAAFTRPTAPFAPDASTVALYHLDEGAGDLIQDRSFAPGGPSPGLRRFGGSPAGPSWVVSDVPFVGGGGQTATVAFLAASSTVAEGAGSAGVSVRITTSNGQPLAAGASIGYGTANGTATAGSDYTSRSGTLSFAAGTVSGATLSVSVPVLNDTITEPVETFTLALSSPSGTLLGSPSSHTVTITDDDTGGSPTLTVSTTTAAPGATVQVTVANGPGNRTDWIGLHRLGTGSTGYYSWTYLNGSQSPPATGLTSVTLSFVMPPTPGDYHFRLYRSNSTTVIATSPTVAVTTGGGGGQTATVAFLAASSTVAEGAGSAGVSVRITTSNGQPLAAGASIGYGTANGTATAGSDYTSRSGTLSFAAGTVSGATLSVSVPVLNDTIMEPVETFTLALSSPSGTLLGSPSSHIVTITDDDTGGSPTLSVSATTAVPGAMVQVTVANGPGNRTDWIGLHRLGTGSTGYYAWRYLNGSQSPPATGLTSATLSFVMPPTPGDYHFRLYRSNSTTVIATSLTVTVR